MMAQEKTHDFGFLKIYEMENQYLSGKTLFTFSLFVCFFSFFFRGSSSKSLNLFFSFDSTREFWGGGYTNGHSPLQPLNQ